VLIAFLLIISEQLEFMRKTDSHINLDRILTVYNPTNYSGYEDSLRKERNDVFRNSLLRDRSITNLTTSSAIPGEPVGFTYVDLAKRSLSDPDKQIPYKVIYVDYDFIPVFNLKLIAGRNYSEASGDRLCIIVTESTIHNLGFTSAEEALNKEIYFMEDDWDKWRIIGVVEDYRHESIKRPVYPTIFRLHRNKGQMVYYSTLLAPGANAMEAVASVEKAWRQTWPEKPFNYFFLDDYYDQQYKSEIHFGRIFTLFAGVAICIACLGILGMTLFEVNARIREISIRKVLGASISNLIRLLAGKNFQLVIASGIISVPVIYFIGSEWLNNYPLRTDVNAWDFILPFSVMVAIVVLASGHQTIKAALINPIKSLRSE
jgi:putative ABC transport system permease protein